MLTTRRRRTASVVLVAVALLGARAASAATGDPAQVLVGSPTTEACGASTVVIDYDVAYVAELYGHGVSAVRLSGLDARCQGHDAVVTLNGPEGAPLAEMSVTVTGGDARLVVPAETPVAAAGLTGVSLVLRGGGG